MNVTSPPLAAGGVESEVQRIRALLKQRHFAEAVDAAAALRPAYPENRDVLYLLALGQRHAHRTAEALATLEELERHHPGWSLLYQERGHGYVVLKDAPRAIEAYERAVQINPALPATWSLLEGLYKMAGNEHQRQLAAAHVKRLQSTPPEVVAATALFCDGELSAAERQIRAFLLRHGNHVEAMRLLARIGVAREVLDDAEILLAAALELAPDYIELRRDYACVLLDRHKHAEAIEQLERLLKLDPKNIDYRTLHATATVGLGDHEGGIRGFTGVLADTSPTSRLAADLHLSIAHAHKTLGRRGAAIGAYKRAIAVRPNFGDAYWSLANLKTYTFSDAEIAQLEAAEADPSTDALDRYHLCFALGKAHEDRAEYALSFRYYERGNALKRAASRYRAELVEQNTARQKQVCTHAFFRERNGYGAASREPIFILGLPRAGSTLLEQILASHSEVEGTQELANVPRVVLDLQGYDPDLNNPRYPACLAAMTADESRALGERYLADTRICCFGNLKQLYARGQEFAYSVDDIARYYRTYLELMEHWDAVLPGRVLRVHYEDVVDDLEGSIRRLLEFCELPFEPACLDYHRTARSIRTASSEQVRQPIFREGLDQWRHYEPWLGPLKEALGDALNRYRERRHEPEAGSRRSVPVR
ncbi:MAG: tetratricopeptide repeat protein [Gammaproteobacteria bacterium]|nr:MAG: tetratricopeptide repeat protein [Gammaproteobacteria bacterium]